MRIQPDTLRTLLIAGTLAAFAAVMLPTNPVAAGADTLRLRSDATLSADRVGPIEIVRDNVTLDCAGHRVTGQGRERGISVDGRKGVVVRNCDVSNFGTGFWIASTTASRFEGNASHDNVLPGGKPAGWNLGAGMWIVSSDTNEFIANRVYGNPGDGIDFMTSSGNLVAGSDIRDNAMAGIYLGKGSDGNRFEDNVVEANLRDGFLFGSVADTVVVGNVARANGAHGFTVVGSTGTSYTGNIAERNAGSGFNVNSDAADNRLIGNTAIDNAYTGFVVTLGSTRTLLADNVATGNMRGFAIGSGTNDNVLERNFASLNGATCTAYCGGFVLYQTTGNELWDSTATDNTGYGFALYESTNNTLTTSTACGNTEGASFEDGMSSGNLWVENVFCEAAP